MKNFKFKLEVILKLRKIEEDKIKMRIGKLNIEREKLKNDIKLQNEKIDSSYQSQRNELEGNTTVEALQFYPAYIEARYQNILILNNKIKDLDEAIVNQNKILATQKAKVKVLDEMKNEQAQEFRKQKMKKIEGTIEENNILWGALRGEIK